MDYFNARISVETAQLLMEMTTIYEDKLQMTVTKGNVLMHAFADAKWVPEHKWQEIRDYSNIKTASYEITPSLQKLKIQISAEVETGLNALKINLTEQFAVRNVTMGVIISYVLKAAYIKYRDQKKMRAMMGTEKAEALDTIFLKFKPQLAALVDANQMAEFEDIYHQLKKEITKKI